MAGTPILFYSPGTCAASEIVAFEWSGLPYRLCRVTREERKGEDYRAAVNRNGQVPALLLPDGSVLTENAALLAWIADEAPDRDLAPGCGTRDRYDLYFWLSWLDSTFHSAHGPYFAPARFVPDPALHEVVKAHSAGAIGDALGRLEEHLASRRFVMLERRTVLDAYVFAMARWSEERLDYATRFPHVRAYLDRLRQDPAVRFLLAVEKGEAVDPPSPGGGFRGHEPWTAVLATLRQPA